jgi:hypothetical protein
MRHSDIRLTMGVYTDPKPLDVREAMDVLPELALDDRMKQSSSPTSLEKIEQKFALEFAEKPREPVQTQGKSDILQPGRIKHSTTPGTFVLASNSMPVNENNPLSLKESGLRSAFNESGREDSNLRPPEPHSETDAFSTFSQNSEVPMPQVVIKPALGRNFWNYILI